MRVAAAVLLLFGVSARAGDASSREGDCVIRVGANDRVTQDETLVVKDGEEVESAVAVHGDVLVKRGAKVSKVVALGGSVTVEGGAVVAGEAVAVGGDVKLAKGARVEKDAVALGGQVRLAEGARVSGAVIGLSLQLGRDLQAKILSELHAAGPCRIEQGSR